MVDFFPLPSFLPLETPSKQARNKRETSETSEAKPGIQFTFLKQRGVHSSLFYIVVCFISIMRHGNMGKPQTMKIVSIVIHANQLPPSVSHIRVLLSSTFLQQGEPFGRRF